MRRPTVRLLQRSMTIVAAIAVSLALALAWEIRRLDGVVAPTTAFEGGTQTALLVLDVQEEYTGRAARPPFPYPASEQLIERINQIAQRSAQSGDHVLYVRQVYSSALARVVSRLLLGGRGRPGSAEAALDRRLRLASIHVADKPGADAFSSPAVRAFMTERHVGKLWLVGLDGAGCVDRTARGARARGISVSIFDDAVVSLDPAKVRALRADYAALEIELVSSAARLGSR